MPLLKKIPNGFYNSVEQLQADVDGIDQYNCNRPHSGRFCYGKTPMQTFLDSKHLVQQKMLDQMFDDTIEEKETSVNQYGDKGEINQTYLTPFVSVR